MKYYLMNAESGYPSANWKTAKGDTYLLDHALSFTQAQIESDTELSNRAIWIPSKIRESRPERTNSTSRCRSPPIGPSAGSRRRSR
jgi:hypothetical protein